MRQTTQQQSADPEACGLCPYRGFKVLLHAQQRFLAHWQPVMQATRGQPEHKGLTRWLADEDP